MEKSNATLTHPAQLPTQRYNLQMQPTMWSNKSQNSNGQNSNFDAYSQQMNHQYQAQFSPQTHDLNRSVSKDQNSNHVSQYPQYSQYPVSRQPNYPSQGANCNNMYFGNMNVVKSYPPNSSKKYANSILSQPQNHQVARNTATPMPQMPHFGEHSSYAMQNMYASNYNVHANTENDQSYVVQPTMTSRTVLSAPDSLMHSTSMVQPTQVSSIPTPPETSSLTSDGISVLDSASTDGSADSMKMNVSNPSFVLPGSVMSHLPNSMPPSVSSASNSVVMSARNTGNSLQPPANLDEGSQASSASASSSIPDEQNSVKTNSKPNFSYPPTPNTLSSPGAASMSSFHDDLECISSPGWPKTPASPVANSNYEFANIKRPENLLKLYTLSDESDRRYFLDKLIMFNEDRGSPITQCPTISKQPLDVFRVYLTVKERGGFVEVTNSKRWKDIAGAIGVGASSSAAYTLRKQYMKLLLPFECKFDLGGIDPQPIINMVEASSRKKGKNSPPGGYGNQGHYSPGYAPPMERYHSGYSGSYQSSRYPCNNNAMDYQCAPNTMHYPQTPSNVPHNVVPGQSQFNQYPHGSTTNYRYYQGNNSSSAGYNSNMPNNSSNLCRYDRSATSTPVPQEQGYFPHQYPASQQGQNVQDMYNSSRGCAVQESHTLPTASSVNSGLEQIAYSSVNNTLDSSQLKPDAGPQEKAIPENLRNLNIDPTLNSSIDTSQDSKLCFSNRYSNKSIPADPTTTNKSCLAAPSASLPYQQPLPENSLNKNPEGSYYSDASATYPNRNQVHYSNPVQNSYPNQKLSYHGDYQNKNQMQSSQYSRFSDSQNEPYRGSEGSPTALIPRSPSVSSNDGSSKPYQYNCASPKMNSYAYTSPQQGHNKDPYNMYSHQYNSRPQRAWLSDQNQHAYQQVGPRPQLKNQLNQSEIKMPETSRSRKSWLAFQNSSQIPNKLQNSPTSMPAPNQGFHSIKSQPQNGPLPAPPFQSSIKKPLEFPPNSIESIRPVAAKRRRCPAKRLGQIDPWRLMLALKSGLLAESTWALDAISILLADNSTVVYFNLDHLPGLLSVLVDHYRCYLNKIFSLAKDLEIQKDDSSEKIMSANNKTCALNDMFGWEGEKKIIDAPNFTYKTRCKKKVEILYDEALFLIDPQQSWDLFEEFNVSAEHWQKGGGDVTCHIQTCFAENVKKIPFCRKLESKDEDNQDINEQSKQFRASLVSKGEPIVVLNKFNFPSDPDTKVDADISTPSSPDKKTDSSEKDQSEKTPDLPYVSEPTLSSIEKEIKAEISCDIKETVLCDSKTVDTPKAEEISESNPEKKNSPQLRGSLSSRKRFLCEDLEDEAYCFDQPALCVMNDSQEMLSRRCVSVSTILRNLSFVPGNDVIMSKNPGVLVLLGRLLLLHHEHKPAKNAYHKYEKEADGNSIWNESCISLKDEHEWWWSTLNVLRDNALVILSNISGHLDLSPFPEEVSLPILDGLLHWVVCPSSYAQDPLPSRSPSSVLSPQRLCLETLCKLSVLSNNVDLIIATPPWSRIENLLTFLTKSLSIGQDQILREFSVVLLSNISQTDTVAARTIAETTCCITYLIAFIEEAEANAFQIASSQGTKKLRDKPELMGTTPGMVQRAANTLKNLALVPENRALFMRHEPQLLSLVMSQVMDQELAAIIADVLFYCSDETMEDISGHLPIS